MTAFLDPILLQRNTDGGWFQLLIPIVFVVIYLIGSLGKVKSESNRKKQTGQRPSPPQPGGDQKRGQYRHLENRQPPRYRSAQERKAGTLPYAHPDSRQAPHPQHRPVPQASTDDILEPIAESEQEMARQEELMRRAAHAKRRLRQPAQQSQVAQKQAYLQQAASQVQTKQKQTSVEEKKDSIKPSSMALQVFQGLRDPGNLRTAILYKEILDKPLSLRDT
ncbi:MAG: hypothetical protein JXA82_00550 [Sedimentisphaerales bacterium]|nr:hypothetical protein [Sedimentisphaerales bacterium]